MTHRPEQVERPLRISFMRQLSGGKQIWASITTFKLATLFVEQTAALPAESTMLAVSAGASVTSFASATGTLVKAGTSPATLPANRCRGADATYRPGRECRCRVMIDAVAGKLKGHRVVAIHHVGPRRQVNRTTFPKPRR
jgi:hypothetical protein